MNALFRRSLGALSSAKRSVSRALLPRSWHIDRPVAQVFLNENGIETDITLVNFPSFLAPEVRPRYRFAVTVTDEAGRPAISQEVELGPFESRELKLRAATPRGIVLVALRPCSTLFYADRALGRLTPHFFVRYVHLGTRSHALIHPQTTAGGPHVPGVPWRSNALVDTRRTRRLVAYQMNTTRELIRTRLQLITAGERRDLAADVLALPPGTVGRSVFELAEGGAERYVLLAADQLTTPNAKPLVFAHAADGSFYAHHG